MSILSEDAKRTIDEWLSGPYDAETKQEIENLLQNDPQTLQNAFYKTLSFGTAGIRGIMGVGTNRLNVYTIRAATQGLANYLKKAGKQPLRVAIGYDCRHNSHLFANETAATLAANGIEVFVSSELRPTPFVSYICREKECSAGIMITASHNPPEYNGYKVYWDDGAQVVSPHAEGIMEEVGSIKDLTAISVANDDDPLIHQLTPDDDKAYIDAIFDLQSCPDINRSHGEELKVVYTNLHGAGITLMEPALKSWGFTNYKLVDTQSTPDASFVTVRSPNPEDPAALAHGEKLLIDTESDVLIATDPDADRIACMVMHEGAPVMLNGNETAVILLHHLLSNPENLPERGAVVSTIVTTRLLEKIALQNGLAYFDVLTGFKYIGEKIKLWETNAAYSFVMGAEESLGYLIGTEARDKDGILVGCVICEAVLQAKLQGKTLIDILYQIYAKNGVYRESCRSVSFGDGEEGVQKMATFMKELRSSPPKVIARQNVQDTTDYLEEQNDLPKADVFTLYLENNSHLIIRPSGTEPKIKIYGFTKQQTNNSIQDAISRCDAFLDEALRFNDLI
jgi:phosphomannomutase